MPSPTVQCHCCALHCVTYSILCAGRKCLSSLAAMRFIEVCSQCVGVSKDPMFMCWLNVYAGDETIQHAPSASTVNLGRYFPAASGTLSSQLCLLVYKVLEVSDQHAFTSNWMMVYY